MRIAAITNSRIPSSTANSIQAMKMCDALVEAGHGVHLFAPREARPSDWGTLSRLYGLRQQFEVSWLPSIRAFRRLDFVWYARAASRTHRPDLVYTWLPQSAAVEARAGGAVVLEMHADVAGLLGAWWLRQFWHSRRGRMLVTTHALRRALERSTGMGFPDARVQVAPNGVDLERYENLPVPAMARAKLGLPDIFTVGFTGHFYAGRGMELLHALAGELPQLHFLWVGGTAEAVEKWRATLRDVNRRNVTLTGFVDNAKLPLYQAAADVLLMPYTRSVSASSGQDIAEVINPMKMFEYMAAERAIISSNLPVIREVLSERAALFCEPEEIQEWKAAILRLHADATLRARLADAGRREVEKHTWIARAKRAVHGFGAV